MFVLNWVAKYGNISVYLSKSNAQKGKGDPEDALKLKVLTFHLPVCGYNIYI